MSDLPPPPPMPDPVDPDPADLPPSARIVVQLPGGRLVDTR